MKKVGFIGTGNMGKALAYSAYLSKSANLILANRTSKKAEELAKEYNCISATNKVTASADYVFI